MTRINPIFAHDCSACTYLGPAKHNGQDFDLYRCRSDGKNLELFGHTVIARYGDDGGSYMSMSELLLERHSARLRGGSLHPLYLALDTVSYSPNGAYAYRTTRCDPCGYCGCETQEDAAGCWPYCSDCKAV